MQRFCLDLDVSDGSEASDPVEPITLESGTFLGSLSDFTRDIKTPLLKGRETLRQISTKKEKKRKTKATAI